MKVVAGSDHAGFELKEQIAAFVREIGFGTCTGVSAPLAAQPRAFASG